MRGVTRVVHVADRQTEVIERGCNVAVLGFEAAQIERQLRFDEPVAAVLSDHQAPAGGVKRAGGVGLAEGEAVGEERKREHIRVCRCLGSLDETVRGGHRLLTGTGDHQARRPGKPG